MNVALLRRAGPWVLVVTLWLVAFGLDYGVWPARNLATLFVAPLAVAALFAGPRPILGLSLLTVAADLLDVRLSAAPWPVWPATFLALLILCYASVQLAMNRETAARRAHEVEAARAQLQQFLGMVAHDLRGPLTVIQGRTQIVQSHLQTNPAIASEMPHLAAVERSARNMRRLIEDLLVAARLGAGRFVIQPALVDLVAVVREIVAEFQEANPQSTLRLDAPDRLDGYWDGERLAQVVANLVSNAIKYSPRRSEVQVVLQGRDGEARLGVIDHGIGITPACRSELFQPFSRLGRDGYEAGTGLGLYIARGIVTAHGGTLWAESTPGQGSTFWASVPIRPPSAASPPTTAGTTRAT
jgi:signal transduction histidine kinase